MIYVPSPVVGQLSGKAGSTRAGANKYAAYITARRFARLLRSFHHQERRQLFGAYARYFATLSDMDRQSWTTYGLNYTVDGRGHRTYDLGNLQAFESTSINLATCGLAVINPAPTFNDPGPMAAFDLTCTGQSPGPALVQANFTPTTIPGDQYLAIFCNPANRKKGINKDVRDYVLTAVLPPGSTNPADITTLYLQLFVSLRTGQHVHSYAKLISDVGVAGAPFFSVDPVL